MKTEEEIRSTPSTFDEKLLFVLEYFLLPNEASDLMSAIYFEEYEIEEIKEMLENFEK